MPRFPFAIFALMLAVVCGNLHAATVPPDTALADKQQVVRHIKDEPSSLDSIKAGGLVEAQVDRDLFEGLGQSGSLRQGDSRRGNTLAD